MKNVKEKLIVALDFDNENSAIRMVDRLSGEVRFFKVGFELFSSCGPSIVKRIKDRGCDVFLDLKYHDIPNTVAKAAASITKLGVYMFNVHASGGYDMMARTREAVTAEAARLKIDRPKILAVTVLTSMDEKALKKIGVDDNINSQVIRLAKLAKEAGLDGVVASPKETAAIRESIDKSFLIITPGVRPAWSPADDQKRIATPMEAVKSGANFVVIGRPITTAKDPAMAARDIFKEMGS